MSNYQSKKLQPKKEELSALFYPQIIQIRESLDLRKSKDLDIDSYIITQVKNKIGDKCIDIGYVEKDSINIVNRSIGKINTSHFNGEIYYDVRVEANVCKPSDGQQIKCKVVGKNKIGLFALAGPLQIVIASVHYNDTSFFEKINKDDEIIVKIVSYKYQLNEDNIKVIAEFVSKV